MNMVSTLRPAPPNMLSATRLKVTVVLNANELPGILSPDGTPRVILGVQLPDRTVTADVAAKSVRKAQAAIRESGADGVAVILQGALAADNKITDAGLSAQPRRQSRRRWRRDEPNKELFVDEKGAAAPEVNQNAAEPMKPY